MSNSVAIVTGASSGIGKAKALRLAREFGAIVLVARSDEQWNTGMELKFHGARRLTIRAWDALRESKGAVVFISGNAAVIPRPGAAAVGAINAAIEALAKAFAERGIEDGVQVNSVSPGAIMTGRRLCRGLQDDHARRNQAAAPQAGRHCPLR